MIFLQYVSVLLILAAGFFASSTCDGGGHQLDAFKGLGDNCEDNTTCIVEFSYCNLTVDTNKYCACLPDYVPDNRTEPPEQCLLKATELEVPDSCEIQTQCRDLANSVCNASGQCVCADNLVANGDKSKCLVANVPIGQSCEEKQQCVGAPNSDCGSISKFCACNDGWVSNFNNTQCLKVVDTLLIDDCIETIQCQRGQPGPLSECVEPSKKCNCTTSAIAIGTDQKCYQIATGVGNACEKDEQCQVGIGESSCNNKICACNPGFFPSNDLSKCLQVVELGKPCEEDTQCTTTPNAKCLINVTNPNLGQTCQCDTGYVADQNTCYALTTVIGGLCNDHDTQCRNLVGARCVQFNETTKTCQCRIADEIENSDKTKCLARLKKLNETCEQTNQCQLIGNSECVLTPNLERQCKCQNDYVESWEQLNTCVPIRNELNEECAEDRQCIEGIGILSECVDGVCQCKRTYGYYNGSCYIPAELGQICHTLEECQVGVNELAFCSQQRCRCQPGTLKLDKTCYLNKSVGDACESNIECTVSIQGPVQCDVNTNSCKCGLGYSSEVGNKLCTSGSTLHFQFSLYMYVAMLIMSSLSLKNSVY